MTQEFFLILWFVKHEHIQWKEEEECWKMVVSETSAILITTTVFSVTMEKGLVNVSLFAQCFQTG